MTLPVPRTVVAWILTVAAALAPAAAVLFAHYLSDATWWLSITFGVLTGIAVYLASREATTEAKAADVGRGVIVGLLVTIALSWIDHQGNERAEAQRQATEALARRAQLAETLSSRSDLRGIDLRGRDLSAFYLAGKNLSDSNLEGANLRDAILRGSTFSGANLAGANLRGADLSEAQLSNANTDLSNADLQGADLTRAKLRATNLRGARLADATLSGAELQGADLRGADLRDAVLPGAKLERALLEADLRGAVFSADLRNASLRGVDIRDAEWDAATRWPPRFDPDRHMAQFEQALEAPPVPAQAREDEVERVVDGDTIVLAGLGGVRLIGVDAPQVELRPQECYGRGSRRDLRALLPPGTPVRYALGVRQQDPYNRSEAYVWTDSGSMVNLELLERGAARLLVSPPNLDYVPLFRDAAVRAVVKRRGLWEAC